MTGKQKEPIEEKNNMSSYEKHKRVLQVFLEVKQQFTLQPIRICHNYLMDRTSFPTLSKLCKEL